MKITAKTTTAAELTTFLSQHSPGTKGYLIGGGATLLGFSGECTVEDFFTITANPDIADKIFVHIKISADKNSEIPAAVNEIAETTLSLEQHIYGYQVKGDILGSFPAGMIAGLIIHAETAKGEKIPHGHLFVIPRVVTKNDTEIVIHQLDVNRRLLKGIKG